MDSPMLDIDATINQWGNGLAVRLNKSVASIAGVAEGTPIRIHVEYGRIVIEKVERRLSLEEMLASYDPERHGGEALAFKPVGGEIPE